MTALFTCAVPRDVEWTPTSLMLSGLAQDSNISQADKDLHLPSGILRASETAGNLGVTIIEQQLTFDAHARACSRACFYRLHALEQALRMPLGRCRFLSAWLILESWQRSIVVRTLVSSGELSLSCARLLAGWVTTLWLSRPLSVSQHGQLSHPSLSGR